MTLHFSHRPAGTYGTGTASSPYADRDFEKRMAANPLAVARLHSDAVCNVRGNFVGFRPRNHVLGEPGSVIRLVNPVDEGSNQCTALAAADEGLTFQGFRLDVNGNAHTNLPGCIFKGIQMQGANNRIADVTVVGTRCLKDVGETWAILILAAHTRSWNNLIERCHVTGFLGTGTQGNGISIAGGIVNGFNCHASGTVRDCFVEGATQAAYMVGASEGVSFINSHAEDCEMGYYNDTGDVIDLSFLKCQFRRCRAGIVQAATHTEGKPMGCRNMVIDGCTLQLAPNGITCLTVVANGGNVTGLQVRNTTLSIAAGLPSLGVFDGANHQATVYFDAVPGYVIRDCHASGNRTGINAKKVWGTMPAEFMAGFQEATA